MAPRYRISDRRTSIFREPLQRLLNPTKELKPWEKQPAWFTGSLAEWAIYWALTRLGEEFVFQADMIGGRHILGGAVADFYLPDRQLIIRVQGVYWHYERGAEVRAADEIQKQALISEGFTVIDIDEDHALRDPLYYTREALEGRDHSPGIERYLTMAIQLAGRVLNDKGVGINGATVKAVPNGSTTPASTTTTANDGLGQAGCWSFTGLADGLYKIVVEYQGKVRELFGASEVQFNNLVIGANAASIDSSGVGKFSDLEIGGQKVVHTLTSSDGSVVLTKTNNSYDLSALLAIAKAGNLVGNRKRLNLIEGANVALTVVDDAINDEVDVTVGVTGVALSGHNHDSTYVNVSGDTMTGNLSFGAGALLSFASESSEKVRYSGTTYLRGVASLTLYDKTNQFYRVYNQSDTPGVTTPTFEVDTTGKVAKVNGGTVWHSGNDGSGSGLDADLLDGQHASSFAPASHNHNSTYYTEAEVDSLLAGKANTSHNHDSAYVNVTGDTMSGNLTAPTLTGNTTVVNNGMRTHRTPYGNQRHIEAGFVNTNDTSPAGAYAITFVNPFVATPSVVFSIEGGSAPLWQGFTGLSTTGVTFEWGNNTGGATIRFCWMAEGQD